MPTWNNAPVDSVELLTFHVYATTKTIGDPFPESRFVDDDWSIGKEEIKFSWNGPDFKFVVSNPEYRPLENQDIDTFRSSLGYKMVSRYYARREAFVRTNVELRRLLYTILSKTYGLDKTDEQLTALVSTDIDYRLDNNLSH